MAHNEDITFKVKEELQCFDNAILLAILNDEIDLKELVKEILINRGLSLSNGGWVGFAEAKAEMGENL